MDKIFSIIGIGIFLVLGGWYLVFAAVWIAFWIYVMAWLNVGLLTGIAYLCGWNKPPPERRTK